MRYISLDLNDVKHEVTGLVIAPSRPGANRPIVTWTHGTTGIGDAACPSAQPDPARELSLYFTPDSCQQIDFGVPGLQGYIDAGYVVVATDYQGLGSPGRHQYLINRSNARDGIYIAHAARALPVGAGKKVLCVGWSQGGGTAAGMAELPDSDFGDLVLLGTACMSPGVPVLSLTNKPTGDAAALSNAKLAPDPHLLMTIMGLASAFPKLRLSDVLTPLGESVVMAAWQHEPVHHFGDTVTRNFNLKGAFMHASFLELPEWRAGLIKGSAARVKPRCPILVLIDGFAGGTQVPVSWQKQYIQKMTELGGKVEERYYPNDDHYSLPKSSTPAVQAWFKQLLAR